LYYFVVLVTIILLRVTLQVGENIQTDGY